MKLSDRINKVKPSKTLEITAKAKRMKKDGIDVISLAAGEPDFDTPKRIKDAAIDAILSGFTKYTPAGGIDELKDAVCKRFERDYGVSYKIEEVVISCGAKHALYNLFQVLFQEGDNIIVISPYWVSYPEMITLCGALPKIVCAKEENDFCPKIEDIEKALDKDTRAILINSPNNPTGALYNKDFLEAVVEIAKDKELWLISDEIYDKFVYEGEFISLTKVGEKIRDKVIVVNGVSKTYSMTGWRIGYLLGPKEVVSAVSKLQSQSTSNPTSFCQVAACFALSNEGIDLGEMISEFKRRRDEGFSMLSSIEGVNCICPKGAFYLFPNFSKYIGKEIRGHLINDSLDLAKLILDEAKVATIPGSPFGADGYLRISYAASLKDIIDGISRIKELLKG